MSRTDIAAAIITRHIMTPIHDAVTFRLADPCNQVVAELAGRDFDNAPVVDDDAGIVGYVNECDAENGISSLGESCFRPLDASQVVSAESPINELLKRLSAVEFLYVVGVPGIVGLITPSDLNKQPGRAYFYLLIADLEVALADCIRRQGMSFDDITSHLYPSNAQRLASNLQEQAENDVVADVVAAMFFSDLVAVAHGAALVAGLKEELVPDGKLVDREIKDFRNDVMHPVKTMVTDRKASIARLRALDTHLRRLLNDAETRQSSLEHEPFDVGRPDRGHGRPSAIKASP